MVLGVHASRLLGVHGSHVLGANGSGSWIWWHWVGTHLGEIRTRVEEHMVLTLLAVGIGFAIAFPLGIISHRWHRLYGPMLAVTSGLYTIPSVALFGLMYPIFGLTRTTAVVPLALYTLLLILRNVVVGFDSVPAEILDAADGMGYTRRRRLVQVELPIALPAVVAGLRIAFVSTIGLVTVTALIGQGGLGRFIIDGQQRDFRTPLVVGTTLSIALAVTVDLLLVGALRLATPWSRSRER
jgi:osmoprotectant transport system permease protein